MDEYGFPDIAVANGILVSKDDYGESREGLEEHWEKWIHHIPFDAPVAQALAELYKGRLENLDKEKEAVPYQRLARKHKLVESRALRYSMDSFSEGRQKNGAL